jgi:hypothetical protein
VAGGGLAKSPGRYVVNGNPLAKKKKTAADPLRLWPFLARGRGGWVSAAISTYSWPCKSFSHMSKSNPCYPMSIYLD